MCLNETTIKKQVIYQRGLLGLAMERSLDKTPYLLLGILG